MRGMRAFIAVDLPQILREEIASFQAELKQSGADVKWVAAGNLHLTLKFLGEIDENQRTAISNELLAVRKNQKPFEIHLEGIGAFPKTTSPRVLWIGVSQGKEQLEELAKRVEEVCVKLGFQPEERPLSAHLTIGRVRSNNQLAPLIKQLQVAEFRGTTPAPIEKLILFQSTLSSQGPTYTPLAEFPLTE